MSDEDRKMTPNVQVNISDVLGQGGWGQDMLMRILANITLEINDLIVSYRYGGNHLTLALGHCLFHSADSNWAQAFVVRTSNVYNAMYTAEYTFL